MLALVACVGKLAGGGIEGPLGICKSWLCLKHEYMVALLLIVNHFTVFMESLYFLRQVGKRGLLLLAVCLWGLLAGHRVVAQTPAWQTAVATGDVLVQATTTDAAGNILLTGGFSGSATFGSTTLSATNG